MEFSSPLSRPSSQPEFAGGGVPVTSRSASSSDMSGSSETDELHDGDEACPGVDDDRTGE